MFESELVFKHCSDTKTNVTLIFCTLIWKQNSWYIFNFSNDMYSDILESQKKLSETFMILKYRSQLANTALWDYLWTFKL